MTVLEDLHIRYIGIGARLQRQFRRDVSDIGHAEMTQIFSESTAKCGTLNAQY